MTSQKNPYRILFLCTGNSARSILAEFILRKIAPKIFEVYSAGSNPKASPHPLALEVLRDQYQLDVTTAQSKSWKELENVSFDFVITLCDDAKETCPVWPGQPIIAHWPSPDPAKFEGTQDEQRKVFWQVAQQIHRRLELLASFPFEKLDFLRLEAVTKEIGLREKIDLPVEKGVISLARFRQILAAQSDQNVTFILPYGGSVPAHAHVTEVGIVQKRFLDCGGKRRDQSFASLQIWVADDTEHRLPAKKLSGILDQAADIFGTQDPEVQVECQDGSIKLFAISGYDVREDQIAFRLENKQTACLAMEICLPASNASSECCGSGCCS